MTRKYTLTMKPENLNSFLTGKPLFIKPKAIVSGDKPKNLKNLILYRKRPNH